MKRPPLAFPVALGLIVVLSFFAILARAQSPAATGQSPAASRQAPIGAPQSPTSVGAKADTGKKPAMTPEQATDPTDPLFGVGPLPQGKVSLVGGMIDKIDRVGNHVRIRPFGDNKKLSFFFDERTHIYRDGVETTERGLRPGDRVYVDSMLDGSRLFARNIRVVSNLKPADARGQIISYEPGSGAMTIRDELSSAPVTFRIAPDTAVKGTGPDSRAELVPGSLVTVRFSPDQRNRQVAREVSVLATPGNRFTFVGKVTFLDMRSQTMAVENQSDNKTYELQFDRGTVGPDVTVGSEVVINAEFMGQGYKVTKLTVSNNSQAKD